jgi:hypothetical protein
MSATARSGTRGIPADEDARAEVDWASREDFVCESSEALRYSIALDRPFSYLEIPALACDGAMRRVHAPPALCPTPGGELAWKVFRLCRAHRKQVRSLVGELLTGVPQELILVRSHAAPARDPARRDA